MRLRLYVTLPVLVPVYVIVAEFRGVWVPVVVWLWLDAVGDAVPDSVCGRLLLLVPV